ncbi:BrxE family protein [Marinobacterium sedimentorum]|uniref:BrxE family protein n=1 Tax=Marinobacterium sedimentorum TaxID=2927804 RepID=UPI0020C65469|nr:BrxE family protein [Marinobacterium sedimentorum]MCP8687147.1 BrxE family protein [Marinobacterium sedimentorum]
MDKDVIKRIADLRIIVGFLGEKDHHDWWPSKFLTPSAKAYLTPIFPRTLLQSQHRGVSEAAALVHDELIGVGSTYHLFRLPESIELEVDRLFQASEADQYAAIISDGAAALQALRDMSSEQMVAQEGPVMLGTYDNDTLSGLMQQIAAHYLAAFEQGGRCYPYIREAA